MSKCISALNDLGRTVTITDCSGQLYRAIRKCSGQGLYHYTEHSIIVTSLPGAFSIREAKWRMLRARQLLSVVARGVYDIHLTIQPTFTIHAHYFRKIFVCGAIWQMSCKRDSTAICLRLK